MKEKKNTYPYGTQITLRLQHELNEYKKKYHKQPDLLIIGEDLAAVMASELSTFCVENGAIKENKFTPASFMGIPIFFVSIDIYNWHGKFEFLSVAKDLEYAKIEIGR